MLRASSITFGYPGAAPVLRDFSWEVGDGEFVGLLGPNGCGKTTLLHLLGGLLTPDAGTVEVGAANGGAGAKRISSLDSRARAQLVGLVSQDALVPFDFTVREVVEMGRYPWHTRFSSLQEAEHQLVDDALHMMDLLGALAAKPVRALSGGERQRVAIARAMVQTPRVLLLDEPTSHLDIRHVADVFRLLHALNEQLGVTIVVVMHDLSLAAAVCPKVALMDDGGHIPATGPPAEVLTGSRLADVYHLPVVATAVDNRHVVLPDYDGGSPLELPSTMRSQWPLANSSAAVSATPTDQA